MHASHPVRDDAAGRDFAVQRSGFIAIDFRSCSPQEISERYQDFGLLCARGKVRSAMLRTGLEDADAHYTLRDILVTVACIVRIPLGFRLALVAGSDAVERVYRTILEDLQMLGCEAQVFRIDEQAAGWLQSPGQRARVAPIEAAVVPAGRAEPS